MEQEIEILIDEYLDGRMDGVERQRFERRMETDPEIRDKVQSATRSVELVSQALGWATPGDEFDSKITSRINEITSGGFSPVHDGERKLTKDDPEARLLHDPAADSEKRRMYWLAAATGLIFAVALAVIIYLVKKGK